MPAISDQDMGAMLAEESRVSHCSLIFTLVHIFYNNYKIIMVY